MPHTSETFLRELDKKLWTAADKLPAGTGILKERGRLAHPYKITSTGKLIDDALEAVEKENPKLKNVLNKNYTQLQIDPANLAGLINLIATIPFLLTNQFAKSVSLERAIKANLRGLGYAL
ncbi:MAG: hypothetical protein RLZZ398_498 [Verrucomicrobiota bacterium]